MKILAIFHNRYIKTTPSNGFRIPSSAHNAQHHQHHHYSHLRSGIGGAGNGYNNNIYSFSRQPFYSANGGGVGGVSSFSPQVLIESEATEKPVLHVNSTFLEFYQI